MVTRSTEPFLEQGDEGGEIWWDGEIGSHALVSIVPVYRQSRPGGLVQAYGLSWQYSFAVSGQVFTYSYQT